MFRRRRSTADFDEEIRSHLELESDELQRGGIAAAEAYRRARVEFGHVQGLRERFYFRHRGEWLDSLGRDLGYGARLLWRSPAFALTAILTLALGLGANSALFSLIQGVILAPLPYPHADRIATVAMDFAPQNNPHGHLSMADFVAWRAANHSFEDVAVYQPHAFAVVGGSTPANVFGARVTSGFFAALRVAPLRGRALTPSDDDGPPVALVGEAFWRNQLGADPAALGRPILLDGNPASVVGVMPADFHFPDPNSEIWTNLRILPPTRLGPYFYRGLARLRPGVSLAAAQADIDRFAAAWGAQRPEMYRRLTMPVEPLREAEVGGARQPLALLMSAVGLVLLLTVVNLAGILLARARARSAEMAVRVSLGARPARLLRQLLTESILLALLGSVAGIALAGVAIAWLRRANPVDLPRIANIHLDVGALAFTVAVAVASGILFGIAPALAAARASTLARAARRDRPRQRSRSALVVAEIALALVLLACAGLLLRSLARLERVDVGFRAPAEEVYATAISLTGPKYRASSSGADPVAGLEFDRAVVARARQLPGVGNAALADALPPFQESDDDTFTIAGQPWTPADFPSDTDVNVSPGYFSTLGIPLLAGRDFAPSDTASSAPVIIVSQSVARRHFPRGDALGHAIKDGEPSLAGPYARIVGIVADSKYQGLDASSEAVYRPIAQSFDPYGSIVVRTRLPEAAVAAGMRRLVRRLDPDAVVAPTQSLAAEIASGLGPRRFVVALLAGFALLALLLAAVGLYGLVAYEVSQRRHEIGIRMALGASSRQVLAATLRQSSRLTLCGIALGWAGTFLLRPLAAGLLFQTSPSDAATWLLATAVLAAVALVASWIPARRAARAEPLAALRMAG